MQILLNQITVVTIGPKATKYRLDRKAFASGVDKFIHVTTADELIDTNFTSSQVAPILNYYIQEEKPDLVLLGKLSTDNDSGITCSIISALSGIECINNVSKIKPIKNDKNDSFVIERDTGSDIQTVEMKLPFIMSCDLSLNEPETPDMFKKPKNKKIEYIKLSDIKSKIGSDYDKLGYKVNNLNIPNLKRSAKILNSSDEIISVLKEKHFL